MRLCAVTSTFKFSSRISRTCDLDALWTEVHRLRINAYVEAVTFRTVPEMRVSVRTHDPNATELAPTPI